METTTTAKASASLEDIRAVVSRVLSLSIFFIGFGFSAAIGLVMQQLALFADYQLTYFAVGVALGIVGIILWLVAR